MLGQLAGREEVGVGVDRRLLGHCWWMTAEGIHKRDVERELCGGGGDLAVSDRRGEEGAGPTVLWAFQQRHTQKNPSFLSSTRLGLGGEDAFRGCCVTQAAQRTLAQGQVESLRQAYVSGSA